jgi:GT2 family glycosyltransferase
VLAQRDGDIQVCVIDNASTDDTRQRVHAIGVKVLVNTQNVGYAAAHNQAIDATTSDYVLTLNSDVWLDPGFVAALTRALDSDSRIGSAAGCLLRVGQLGHSPTQIDSAGLFMTTGARSSCRGLSPLAPDRFCPIFGQTGGGLLPPDYARWHSSE